MRTIRNLIGLLIGLSLLAAIGSAIAALIARDRIESSGSDADDELDVVTIYDSRTVRATSLALRRISMLCWYGGGTLDLRGATLASDGATIDLKAIFGGIRLVVPPSWRIDSQLTAIFGGTGDTRDQALVSPEGPTVRLAGWAVFGGVGIVADAPDLDVADAVGGDEPVAGVETLAPSPAMA